MSESRHQWSSRTKLTVTLLLIALTLFLLYRFRVVLAPLILAIILAYVLSPLAAILIRRLGINRTLATVLIYFVLFALIFALPLSVIPPLVDQTTELNLDIQRFLMAVEELLEYRYEVAGQVIDLDFLFQQLVGSLQGIAEPIFGQTLLLAFDVITSLVWIVFILVVSFYLVKDGPKLRDWLEKFTPPLFRSDYVRLREEINQIWSSFFRGQIVLGLVVASIITMVGFFVGLPFALAMGVLAGILELLPSIGHGIWLFIASLLALFLGSTWLPIPNWIFTLLIIGLHIVFQQFDRNYLIPRIIGRRPQLPPLVIILGIVTGAVLAGVLGIFLAAPTIASARVVGRYIYANLFDLKTFPESEETSLPPPDPQWWRKRPSSIQSDNSEDS